MKIYIGKFNQTEWHYYTEKGCKGKYLGYIYQDESTKTYRVFPNNNTSIGIFISKRTAQQELKELAR